MAFLMVFLTVDKKKSLVAHCKHYHMKGRPGELPALGGLPYGIAYSGRDKKSGGSL